MEPSVAATAAAAASYLLAAIMIGVGCAWAFLIKSMADSFRLAPYLDGFGGGGWEGGAGGGEARPPPGRAPPRVSVILPARNEEGFIGRCLESLAGQDYPNYEIIAIDDSSEDATPEIIAGYARDRPGVVVPVSARPKPDGWMGKNWACMEGYRRAGGEILLFTDADTVHSGGVISLAVAHMLSRNLDALSAIPRLLALDFWTGITLPVIATFLHTRFSALNVNNPAKKTGYFFGSFFVLRRDAYERVGTHEGVRREIIEDGALGRKVKESGCRMRMVRAEHLITAVWARDRATLWDALKRLMVPLYLQGRWTAAGILAAVAFLLFVPFLALAASLALLPSGAAPVHALCASAAAASIMVWAGTAVEARAGLGLGLANALLAPLGGAVVVSGFLAGLVRAGREQSITWRGRRYTPRDHGGVQDSVNI